MNLFKKLSAAETRRLAAFLESVACPPDTMNIMEIKGFLFGVCCAPVVSKPSEWIPEIFNHRPANFATTEEAEFVNTALVRLYNQLMADVNEAAPALPTACKYKEPCAVNFERGNALHEWCKGFNEAHHLYFDHWEAGIAEDEELMAAVGFMVLTLGFFDDRDESRQMLDMAFDVDLPLHEMAPIVRAQMPQVMKEYARIGRAMYEEMLEDETPRAPATKTTSASSNVVPFRVPHRDDDARDRLLQAEELALQALEESDHEKRVALARKALSISDDCARALTLLAEDAAESLEESAHYYHRAMEAARRAVGARAFAEFEEHGMFWGALETRPYMVAKAGYADTLWALERTTEALHEYEELLRLNPDDNQGIRYILAIRYLDIGYLDKAHALLETYDEEGTWWSYTRALHDFLVRPEGSDARKIRAVALKANAHVLDYFTGKRRMPKALPDYYSPGSLEEAVLYAHEARTTWRAKPGAIEWLKAGLKTAATARRASVAAPASTKGATSAGKKKSASLKADTKDTPKKASKAASQSSSKSTSKTASKSSSKTSSKTPSKGTTGRASKKRS